MRELGLKSKVSKKFRPKTTVVDPSKKPAENLLDQVFSAEAPNQKWVTDITYLPTAEGWVYLAAVLDLFSRKIVGWAMSASLAIESRRPPRLDQLLHHSDRGVPVHQRRLSKNLEDARHHLFDEPHRLLL